MLEFHYFDRAGGDTFAAFYAVGMEIAVFIATTVIRSELHGAYPGATFAFHLARVIDMYVDESVWQMGVFRRHP